MFGVNFKSYPTSINIITLRMNPCSCRGICLSSRCVSSKHTYNPFDKTMKILCLHLFHPFVEVNLPLSLMFPFWDGGYFRLACIYLCASSFIIFFWVAFQVWCMSFTRLFCPIWFYEWLRLFFEVCGYIVQGHVPPSISHWFLHLDS
jgi:hypothetical protein